VNYVELTCKISPREPFSDLVIAELAELGFDMFEDDEDGVRAYIQADSFDEAGLTSISYFSPNTFCIVSWTKKIILHQNWNEEWEKNFQPIVIADQIYVRAVFHPAETKYPFEIVIQPKMSFGTGHHETTSLVMTRMLMLDFKGKSVLDMGTGSAILAILAGMLGAENILAVDYDTNATENAAENCNTNGFPNVIIKTGSVEVIRNHKFDIILANINRNILLEQLSDYALCLHDSGLLVLSGFYEDDIPVLQEEAKSHGFELTNESVKNKWCELLLKKC
jgi:ribosomal protein L11 methyltransferase